MILFAVYFLYISKDRSGYIFISRLYIIFEFSLISWIFSVALTKKIIKSIIIAFIPPFILFCVYDYFSSDSPSIAYGPLLVQCVFFTIVVVYFFFEKMKQPAIEPLFQTFIFWFAVAVLINYSGNFLLFVYSQTSNSEPDFKANYTIVYSTVTILKNVLFCISIIVKEPANRVFNLSRTMDFDDGMKHLQTNRFFES